MNNKVLGGKVYTSEVVNMAIQQIGADKVRQIVYGENQEHEYIGIRMFIDSRQDWCKNGIIDKLNAIINR